MWFRQRSTRRRGPRGGGLAHGTRSEKRKGSPSVEKHGVEVYAVAATHERNIDDILPHEADDKTIRQKVSTLLDQLELHVENFYTDVPVQIDPDTERQLSRFSTPLLSEPLAALLNSTNRPTTLIKHCLVFYVLNLTSSSAGSSGSLLPAQIVEMHRAVAKAQERDPLDSNTTFAFSRWRALTAFLRPEILSEKSLLDTAPGRAAVSDAVHVFSLAFHAWSSREHPDTERERHMANLLRSAVALRTWLFSQTSSFEFDWEPNVEPRERSSRVGVVVPGLLKTVDSKGVMLVRRVRILEGVVKRV